MNILFYDLEDLNLAYLKKIYCQERRPYTNALCELDPGHIARNESHGGRDNHGRWHSWKLPIQQLQLPV